MSDVLSTVYSHGEEAHGIYASKHVKLVDNVYDTLDKELNYIEKTLSDHHNSISNNNTFMNTTRDLLTAHSSNKDNPHNTTKAQVGLGNCDNTADNVKEVLSATKWTASRTLTIGNASRNVNGLYDVSWSLAEIGAVNKAGDTMSGPLRSTYATGSWLEGYKGNALLSSMVQGGSHVSFTRYPSKNGVFCICGYDKHMCVAYTSNNDIKAELNSVSKAVIILDESGNSAFPGNVGAVSFTGPVTGNATSATKWNTARTLTIGNCNRSLDGTSNVSWPLDEIGALPLTGGTVTGKTYFKTGYNVMNFGSTVVSAGYIMVAQIKITNNYVNSPIEFKIVNRGAKFPMYVSVLFSSVPNVDPSLNKFTFRGCDIGAYIIRSAESTWDIYVKKSEAYDSMAITDISGDMRFLNSMLMVSYPGTFAATLPEGCIAATRLEQASTATKLETPRKIGNATFDGTKDITVQEIGYDKESLMTEVVSMIYPVGSIKMTYDNINPGTYLKNTTWELTSKGAYIRGVNPSDSNLSSAKTGGSLSVDISHSHTIAAHTHTLNHTHTIAAHTHTIAHAHSINGHSHTVNSHAHSTSGTALTVAQMPSHNHVVNFADMHYGYSGQPNHNHSRGTWTDSNSYAQQASEQSDFLGGNGWVVRYTGDGGSHAHGDTGASAPGTNAVALNTNSGGGNSGGTALTTASGGGTSSGTALTTNSSGGTKNIEPTYQTLYCWRRTA